jgi:hypothetical protein
MNEQKKASLERIQERISQKHTAIVQLEDELDEMRVEEREFLTAWVVSEMPEYKDTPLDHDIHMKWGCKKSPTGLCFYNVDDDPVHDECLLCGHPEERK